MLVFCLTCLPHSPWLNSFFFPIWKTYLLKCYHQSAKDTLPDTASASLTKHKYTLVWGCLPHSLAPRVFLACLTTRVQFGIFILTSSFYWDNSITLTEPGIGHGWGGWYGMARKLPVLLIYLLLHLFLWIFAFLPILVYIGSVSAQKV